MQIPLAFVAFSDAELQWLVNALQNARSSLPWQPQSLQAHEGTWVLRVQGPLALYQAIAAARPAAWPDSAADAPDDRLSRFMRNASKPPQTAPTSSTSSTLLPAPPDTNQSYRSAQARSGQFAGADWRGHSFALQDLRGADFSAADLRGADFHGANLQGASFRQARLGLVQAGTGLAHWRLPAYRLLLDRNRFLTLAAASLLLLVIVLASLLQAGYAGASLCGLIWVVGMLLLDQKHTGWRQKLANGGTRFDAANLQQADFSGAQIGLVNFEMANLQQVCWHGAVREMALYFSDPLLCQSGVPGLLAGQRERQDFSGHDLSAQNLADLDLSGFDFTGANLQGTDLSGCNLKGARLSGANLCGADLSRANLSGADLSAWQIDFQTVLVQLECDYWYGVPHSASHGTALPEPADLLPQRWPPEPGRLRPGEFAHLVMHRVGTVRFLAANVGLCLARLDLLLQLATSLPIRLRQIHFDANLQVYGQPCLSGQAESTGSANGMNVAEGAEVAMGYQIEVEFGASVNLMALCQVVWLCDAAVADGADRLPGMLAQLAG